MSILVVETDDIIRKSLREWLEGVVPGWRISEAGCKEEAIALAQGEWPKMILVDIADPNQDGVETVREIKAAAPWAAVVALAMHDHKAYRDDLISAGASASLLIWKIRAELLPTLNKLFGGEKPPWEREAAEEGA